MGGGEICYPSRVSDDSALCRISLTTSLTVEPNLIRRVLNSVSVFFFLFFFLNFGKLYFICIKSLECEIGCLFASEKVAKLSRNLWLVKSSSVLGKAVRLRTALTLLNQKTYGHFWIFFSFLNHCNLVTFLGTCSSAANYLRISD